MVLKVPALGMNSTCPWPGDAIATASAALALVLLPASEHPARHDASTVSAASGRPCGIRKRTPQCRVAGGGVVGGECREKTLAEKKKKLPSSGERN